MTAMLRRALLALLLLLPTTGIAHEGHGDEPAAATGALPRVEASSDLFELVGILGPGGALVVYLDRFADNAPVDGAEIAVTLRDQEAKAERIGEGVYRVRLSPLATPGGYDLAFAVTAGAEMDLLAGGIDVPAPPAAAVTTHGWLEALREAPVLAICGAFLLLVGGVLGRLSGARPLPPMVEVEPAPLAHPAAAPVLVRAEGAEPVTARRVAAPVSLLLLVLAAAPALGQPGGSPQEVPEPPRRQPDGAVFVPKPTQRLLEVRTRIAERGRAETSVQLFGTVVPDPNASGRVQPSQTGRLEPGDRGLPVLGQRVEAGQVLAYVTPTYSASERGTLQQGIAELDQQIGILQARVNRLNALRGSVADRDIQEAVAELAGLRQRRAAIQPALSGREALRAPVDGVVSHVRAAIGQVVDGTAAVFEIVDPSRLWVEALAFDQTALGTVAGASLLLPDGRTAPLELAGRGLAVRQGAVPLNFRLATPPDGLSVGAPVTVLLRLPRRQEGVLLPADAVVRSAEGPPVVYSHASAERFVPLQVRSEPLDGARVLVTAGVAPGTRVVVRGAGLLAQVR